MDGMNFAHTKHFPEYESAFSKAYGDIKKTADAIINNYISANPPYSIVYKAHSSKGFLQLENGLYDLNLKDKKISLQNDGHCYIYGVMWCDIDKTVPVDIKCYGPVALFVNSSLIYNSAQSSINNTEKINITFHKGNNTLLFRCENTSMGIGCAFGGNQILNIMSPFCERIGQSGFVYSELTDKDAKFTDDYSISEVETELCWYPKICFDKPGKHENDFELVYGYQEDSKVYAYTTFFSDSIYNTEYLIKGIASGNLSIYIDGKKTGVWDGTFDFVYNLGFGKHNIMVECFSHNREWGFDLKIFKENSLCNLIIPEGIKGAQGAWLYLGVFDKDYNCDVEDIMCLHRVAIDEKSGVANYWRCNMPDVYIRPYIENRLFGKWTYPLGVTLYGLIKTAEHFGLDGVSNYVNAHFDECCKFYDYAFWDKKMYGYPSVNQSAVNMTMLDHCGSFVFAMFNAYSEDYQPIFDDVADFMMNRLSRLDDGTFYRCKKDAFYHNTLWADDLFMSIPFLAKYYKNTDNELYLNEIIMQFELFWKYLYLDDEGVFSHIYSTSEKKANRIPWGRGNGWAMFSLAEAIEIVDDTNKSKKLIDMLNTLAYGIIKTQDCEGMWHQVLNDGESYQEASCTAMFVYALAKAVRLGIATDYDLYLKAAMNGWNALCKYNIDRFGNVYGICKGSRYSFNSDYYKYDLPYVTNDPHGIGVVLLAGIEIGKITEYLMDK